MVPITVLVWPALTRCWLVGLIVFKRRAGAGVEEE